MAEEEEAAEEEVFLLRATRGIAEGEEAELDYGPRSNAEMLTTHGFALTSNPHELLPLALGPSDDDPLGALKRRILDAGNMTSPFGLSARALHEDSDLLVALRILVASGPELKQYQEVPQLVVPMPVAASAGTAVGGTHHSAPSAAHTAQRTQRSQPPGHPAGWSPRHPTQPSRSFL